MGNFVAEQIAMPQVNAKHVAQVQHRRRTASDDVFDYLYSNIISLKIAPGTKMSETEIAKQFGISRQPVREAFIRLGDMKLLEIRPQRATTVRKIYHKEILDARFIRAAVEVEVARLACERYDGAYDDDFAANLARQKQALESMKFDEFHALDYDFHLLLCVAADCEFAHKTIVDNKSHVDRLCVLSLASKEHSQTVYDDHLEIFNALKAQDVDRLTGSLRTHLTRLDSTIDRVRAAHGNYFQE